MGAPLTIVMPFYDNAGMLGLQYRGWALWPEALRARLRVIIVDDGSPVPAADVPRPDGLEIAIYRVMEDRPWHQHGSRNLGAHVANDGWLLLTDMDHVLSAESAEKLFAAMDGLDPGTIYMLDRVEADTGLPTLGNDGQPKPHPNSFVVTRETFWRIGGYDEAYCGVYGTDGLFRERAFTRAHKGHLSISLTRYWREIVPDASTRTLPRKEGREPGAKDRVRREKAERGEADKIVTLDFPWERVC